MNRLKSYKQKSAYDSPWSLRMRIRTQLWELTWVVFCRWTPKPLNSWRLFWIKQFGAVIIGTPFVHQRARITHPWRLAMHDRSCLGDGAIAYSLGEIEIMAHATVSQEAYLCTGTHKFDDPNRPLQTGKITIGPSAFIGARAFVMPGITVGKGAIVGACSVVVTDVQPGLVVAGNPAKPVKKFLTKY